MVGVLLELPDLESRLSTGALDASDDSVSGRVCRALTALEQLLGIVFAVSRDTVGLVAMIVFATGLGEVVLGTTAVLALFETVGALGMARGFYEHGFALAATTVVLIVATAIMSVWLFIGAWLVQAVVP